jgi:hydrogenase nickel incorporation protein HypA/HybF
MHEAGVVERILEAVSERALDAQASRVTDVYLEVGEDAGIDRESLAFHWAIDSEGTIATGARLHFEASENPRAFRLSGIEIEDGTPEPG